MKKKILILLLVGLAICSVIPFEILTIPPIKLQAIDQNGVAIENTVVSQDWQHYTFESKRHTDRQATNKDGYVYFPEKKIKVMFIRYLVGSIFEKIPINPHASSGPYASFYVEDYDSNLLRYKPGEEIPTQIVVNKKFEIEKEN